MQTYSNFKRAKVLGVKIDDVSKEEGLEIVERWRGGGKLIFTPGPEFLVTAQRDLEFKRILNAGDLNLPDGYGLKIFSGITHIVPGVEFMLALCQLAAEKGWTVGMLGNPNTRLAAKELYRLFPKLKIIFAYDNPEADRLIGDYDTLKYVDGPRPNEKNEE